MTMPNPCPLALPWSFVAPCDIQSSDGAWVCTCACEEDAREILRRVNAYDAAMEALQLANDYADFSAMPDAREAVQKALASRPAAKEEV